MRATARTARRRSTIRRATELRSILAAHERNGDRAREHSLYDDAAQSYRKALELETVELSDRLRITEKLIRTYFLGDNPSAAAPLVEWLSNHYLTQPSTDENALHALSLANVQLWLDSKTEQSLTMAEHLSAIATGLDLQETYAISQLRRMRILHQLDRNEEAEAIFKTLPEPDGTASNRLRFFYYEAEGIITALRGEPERMYRAFQKMLQAAEADKSASMVLCVWEDCIFCAGAVGDLQAQKGHCESAILVARQSQFSWSLANLYIEYAEILCAMGQYSRGREYLARGLTHTARPAVLTVLLAEVGIHMALRLKDPELLASCEIPDALPLVFQSGNPTRIAETSASFAELYASRGQRRRAQALLRRAVQPIRRMEGTWKFPRAVARHGDTFTIERTRALLSQRSALPYGELARANLMLFDALLAHRRDQTVRARQHALAAIKLCKKLNWYRFIDEAYRIANVSARGMRIEYDVPFLAGFEPALTKREEQVVESILSGSTNRAIAGELGISENTVEKHISSIINRLGIRSRYQIAAAVGRAPRFFKGTDSVMLH